jgi:hypothetical protein
MPGELAVHRSRLSEVTFAGRTMLMYGSGELDVDGLALSIKASPVPSLYQETELVSMT